jgi:hypothetical protein
MDRSRQYWDIVFFLIDTLDRLNVTQMSVEAVIGGRIRRRDGGDRLGKRIGQARSENKHTRTPK